MTGPGESGQGTDRLTGLALWGGAGMVAGVLHLLLVQQGLAAMGKARDTLPPEMPVIEVMAVATTLQGEDQPIETARPVASEALRPQTGAERLNAAGPAAERVQGATAATAAAAQAAAPAAPPKLAALSPSGAAQGIAASPARPEAASPVARPSPAPTAPASGATRLAPSVSTATVARPAAPAPRQPGLRPVASSPGSTATVAARPPAPVAAAAQSPAPSAPVTVNPVTTNPVSGPVAVAPGAAAPAATPPAAAPSGAARVASVAPAASLAPAVRPATPSASAPASAASTAAAAPAPALTPVPSLPPPASSPAQEGVAAPLPENAPVAPANEDTYDSVLDHLAEVEQPACFAAMPSLSDEGAFQLEVFARDAADLDLFRNRLEARLGQRMPNTTMKAISADQCAVLAFLTEGPSYPRFRLFFDLPQRVIASGAALEGRIGNTSGGFVTFLVIDDEGTVQDLATFLKFVPGGAQFSVPLSLTAGPVETQQLLMVLSTPARLRTVEAQNGGKAESFFPMLAAELRERGQTEDAAIVAFSVR